MAFARVLVGLILLGTASSMASDGPTIRVFVLDALDGKPQAGVPVSYLCDEIPHVLPQPVTTDKTGVALVPYSCKPGNKIELEAVPKNHKEGCGSGVDVGVEEVQSTGIVSRPDSAGGIWCPTKISRRLTPVPGQVILFIKKPTWWQSHVAV
jgi:hypothetical protein